jgi:flagellin-specific chaperone FliS
VELRSKSDDKEAPELETCFIALYGYLLLKVQKKEISKETQAAVTQITALLRLLSKKYREVDTQEQNIV